MVVRPESRIERATPPPIRVLKPDLEITRAIELDPRGGWPIGESGDVERVERATRESVVAGDRPLRLAALLASTRGQPVRIINDDPVSRSRPSRTSGEHFATLETRLILSQVLRAFHVQPKDAGDPKLVANIALRMADGMPARVSKR